MPDRLARPRELLRQYKKTLEPHKKLLKDYWRFYGGRRALVTSPYLHLSIACTLISFPLWLPFWDVSPDWQEMTLNVVPSLLGLSIGGMAILLALSDPSTFKALTQSGRPDSFFVKLISALFHFIIIQFAAITLCIFYSAYPFWPIGMIGVFFLFYSLLTAVATAGQLFNTARIHNAAPRAGVAVENSAKLSEEKNADLDQDGP